MDELSFNRARPWLYRTEELDRLSQSLQAIAREYYRKSCEDLKNDAQAGKIPGGAICRRIASGGTGVAAAILGKQRIGTVRAFTANGDQVHYLVRHEKEVLVYSRTLSGVRMQELTLQYRQARAQVQKLRQRDLRRGLTYTLVLVSAGVWILALVSTVYVANRISRPIRELTDGLHHLAGGNFDTRLSVRGRDEIGKAVEAFNHTAGHLQQNRDRLVYLTQVASWQTLARKMAHELKNSLTPIRLMVEEILARSPAENRQFLEQAAQVVIEEVESLERHVRSFSEFAAEPPVKACRLDFDAILEERIRFLEVAHPDVHYQIERPRSLPAAWADSDQVKGILTNLLENAAEAAGPGGIVRAITCIETGRPAIEVHDSGPGSARVHAVHCLSRLFLSKKTAWVWGFPSRAKMHCWPEEIS